MKIEKSNYTGYLWESDKKEPSVLRNEPFSRDFKDQSNPFIVEGLLFDGKTSYSIKYVDGNYLVNKTDVHPGDFSNPDVVHKSYIANFKGVGWLKFLEYWEPEPDGKSEQNGEPERYDMCEGMKVLRMKKRVFVGFINEEEERKIWQR